jgi:hypothetical protein
MSHVFMSYAREDRGKAEALARILEADGQSVWWDRTIPPGRSFDEVIEEALAEARCVVTLWSSHAVASRWVRAEAEEADRRGVLVPALVESVELPLRFRQIQAANLSDWTGQPDHPELERLRASVAARLAQAPLPQGTEPEEPQRVEPPEPRPGVPPPRRRSRPLLVVLVALLLFGALAAGGYYFYEQVQAERRDSERLRSEAVREEQARLEALAERRRWAEEQERLEGLAERQRRAEEQERLEGLAERQRRAEEQERLEGLAERQRRTEEQERLATALQRQAEEEARRRAEAPRRAWGDWGELTPVRVDASFDPRAAGYVYAVGFLTGAGVRGEAGYVRMVHAESGEPLFRGEKRRSAVVGRLDDGVDFVRYDYLDESKRRDAWIYVPAQRRVRRARPPGQAAPRELTGLELIRETLRDLEIGDIELTGEASGEITSRGALRRFIDVGRLTGGH